MTAHTWTSAVSNASDADFRAWGSELAGKLAVVNLVQTADTGQINWVTVTRPTLATYAGYEIWRTADSSLYYKIEYGTINNAASPGLRISVGTGSNGSGALTGAVTAAFNVNINTYFLTSPGSAFPSYISASNNHLSLMYKVGGGGVTIPLCFFSIGKIVDTAGAWTNDGISAAYSGSSQPQCLNYCMRIISPAALYGPSLFHGVVPMALTSTLTPGGNLQVYPSFGSYPEMRPCVGHNVYRNTEITAFTTYTVAMVASVTHTYLALGNGPLSSVFSLQNFGAASTYSLGMLYE